MDRTLIEQNLGCVLQVPAWVLVSSSWAIDVRYFTGYGTFVDMCDVVVLDR